MAAFSRPSHGTVVAYIALFVAVGGTSYAAATINGSSLKDRSVAARKLHKHAITRTELSLSRLGTLPAAATLQGRHASDFASASQFRSSGGLRRIKAGPSPDGHTATILTIGPFTLTEQCIDKGSGTLTYNLLLSTSAPLAIANYGMTYNLDANPTKPATLFTYTTGGDFYVAAVPWGAVTTDGRAVNGMAAVGIGPLIGQDCSTSVFAVK